jgi:DNA polymerase III epsilon subunit-like protein
MYLDGRMNAGEKPWLAGYNAVCFDGPLLNAEFVRAGLAPPITPDRIVDPMVFVRWHLRHLRSRTLENICRHFGIDRGRSHSALDDAKATGELLLTLVRQGLLPPLVEPALTEQALLRRRLDAEWRSFGYWLYHDRSDGRLRLGAGSYIGSPLSEVSPDYLRSLVSKIGDLPDLVRTTFLAGAARPSTPLQDLAAAV